MRRRRRALNYLGRNAGVVASLRMSLYAVPPSDPPHAGALLRYWRELRRMSQLELALTAEVSARHVSFIETGRAAPSREMVLILASALEVPLRERNAVLLAAGFAPAYGETRLEAPQMQQIVRALTLLLRQYEPSGAMVLDGRLDIVMVNGAYARMLAALGAAALPALQILPAPRANALELLLRPGPLRSAIGNLEEVARETIERTRRELSRRPDAGQRVWLERLVREAGLHAGRGPQPDALSLVLPVELNLGGGGATLRLLSTLTTLGSPHDITLDELRIESFHPADEETEELVRPA